MPLWTAPGKGARLPLLLVDPMRNPGHTGMELWSLVSCPVSLHVLVLAGKVPTQTNDPPQ